MEERTSRIFTPEELEKIHHAKILIFGLGGVGGMVCEALVRTGIHHIHIVDGDTVAESNLNRQVISNVDTIGMPKTEVMEQFLKRINPNIEVQKTNQFITKEMAHLFDFSQYDYVIDCIDTVSTKIEIITQCKEKNVPIISSMGAAFRINPMMFEILDLSKTQNDPLARTMRYELRKRGIQHVKVACSKELPQKRQDLEKDGILGSTMFGPASMGLTIAYQVILDIKGDEKNE